MVRAFLEGVDRFGLAKAESYQKELGSIFELIADQPGMGRRIPSSNSLEVRAHPHARHVIIYEVADDDVTILRIRHGREDWIGDPIG